MINAGAIGFIAIVLMAVDIVSSVSAAVRRGNPVRRFYVAGLGLAFASVIMPIWWKSDSLLSGVVFSVAGVLAATSCLAGTISERGTRESSRIPSLLGVALLFLAVIVGSGKIISGSMGLLRGFSFGHEMSALYPALMLAAATAFWADHAIEIWRDNVGTLMFSFVSFGAMAFVTIGILRPELAGSPLWLFIGIAFFIGAPMFMGIEASRSFRSLLNNIRDGIQALREGRALEVAETHGQTRDLAEAFGTMMWAVQGSQEELRNKLIELEERDQARREFLQNISHELRTPLAGVIGHADLLIAMNAKKNAANPKGPTDDDGRFALAIKEQGSNLLRIINDLLEFSKVETGQLKIFPRAIDIGFMLSEVGHALRPYSHRNKLEIQIDRREAFVNADPSRMRQVLMHLANNAVKFTPKGGRVHMAINPATKDKGTVEIMIEDNGMGIPPEAMERLFKGFRQGDGSAGREHGGLGIGLALSHAIVEAHGGKLTVTSKLGEGTRALISMSRVEAPPKTPEIPDIISDSLVIMLTPDRGLAELVREQLRNTSIAVGLVFRNEDLGAAIKKYSPRALIVHLTEADGDGAFSRDSLGRIPVVYIGGEEEGSDTDYHGEMLGLPFDRDQLMGALKRAFSNGPKIERRNGNASSRRGAIDNVA